jgi:hypothetical protein
MKPVSIELLHGSLKRAGFTEIRFGDENYVAPSRSWLGEFASYIRSNAPAYFAQKFDCENFARWASCEADKALYASEVTDAGHTFAEARCVLQKDGKSQMHALNVVLCDDEKLYVLEPQNGGVFLLDDFDALWTSVRL